MRRPEGGMGEKEQVTEGRSDQFKAIQDFQFDFFDNELVFKVGEIDLVGPQNITFAHRRPLMSKIPWWDTFGQHCLPTPANRCCSSHSLIDWGHGQEEQGQNYSRCPSNSDFWQIFAHCRAVHQGFQVSSDLIIGVLEFPMRFQDLVSRRTDITWKFLGIAEISIVLRAVGRVVLTVLVAV